MIISMIIVIIIIISSSSSRMMIVIIITFIMDIMDHPLLHMAGLLVRASACTEASSERIGRGDDTVGNPYRAQIYKFELCELKYLNSSFSSLSSY